MPSEAPAANGATVTKTETVVMAAQVAAGYRDFCVPLDEDEENDPAECYRESMEAS